MKTKLDEWQAIIDAAPEGPLTVAYRSPDRYQIQQHLRGHMPVGEAVSHDAAVLLATARTAMPELIAMVRGLMELVPHDDGCAIVNGVEFYTDHATGLNMMRASRGPCNCTRDARIAAKMGGSK